MKVPGTEAVAFNCVELRGVGLVIAAGFAQVMIGVVLAVAAVVLVTAMVAVAETGA